MSSKQVNLPRPVDVSTDTANTPAKVRLQKRSTWRTVTSVIEQWHIDDRWWSDAPVQRDYFHVEFENGTAIVVFRDLRKGAWYAQR